MSDVLQAISAFGAGILSFFSPCVLPLVPAYLCFISGLSAEDLRMQKEGHRIMTKNVLSGTLLFILGFSLVFVVLGASATYLGSFLAANRKIIKLIGGIIVIVFGMHISGVFNISFLQYEKKFHIQKKPVNKIGTLLVGMAFGFGWTPCIGPMLGSILMLAATKDSLLKGILLLSCYSLGMALPFLILSMGIDRMIGLVSKANKYFKFISTISGILLIIIGIYIILSSF